MSLITEPRLLENILFHKIDTLEQSINNLKTKQSRTSDTQSPLTAGLVTTGDYQASVAATWEDIPSLTVNITISESSIIMVVMSAHLFATVSPGGDVLARTRMVWNGTPTGKQAVRFCDGAVTLHNNVQQVIRITESIAGTYTLKMQVQGDANVAVAAQWSNFIYFVFRQ
jgi:hypothetical protein